MNGRLKTIGAVVLFVVSLAVAALSIILSIRRPLSPLEASLLNVFLWGSAVGIGAITSSVVVQRSTIDSLQERAKPAIRRVSELLRASQKLQIRLEHTEGRFGHTVLARPDDSLSLIVDQHVGQLRAAVQDWRELLPEDYVDEVLSEAAAASRPGAMSWFEFEETYQRLARQVEASPSREGHRPSFMIGVYPEGGMVGYFLWLQMGRRCPIFVAPDADREPSEEEMAALGSRLKALCPGHGPHRCLIVDASIKTGRSMAKTKEIVETICERFDIEVNIKTLCFVQYPLPHAPLVDADFCGERRAVHLPFSEA